MWQTYASKLGVIIRTTIGDFINSLKTCNDYDTLRCCKIKYKNATFYDSFDTYLTTKDKAFRDEQELRFYFLNEATEKKEHKIFVPIDYKKMIKSVAISPFVDGATSNWLCKLLSTEFGLMTSQSEIKLNK